jgi:hypothetical protein
MRPNTTGSSSTSLQTWRCRTAPTNNSSSPPAVPNRYRRTLTRLQDRGAHRALVWLPQDAGGAISDSDTARFLDDVVANTLTE